MIGQLKNIVQVGFILCVLGLIPNALIAQCTNLWSWGSATAPTGTTPLTISTCTYQEEYNTVSSVVAGQTYISTYDLGGCITVHSGTPGGPVVGFGSSPLTWTATVSGTYYIHYTTSCVTCGQAYSCGTTTITCSSCGGGGGTNPCTSITNIASCGSSVTANMSGTGAGWSPGACLWSTPGDEVIFSFTPTTSGAHTISVTSFTGPDYVDIMYVNSTSGCSSSAPWTCISDVFGTGNTGSFSLTAGQTYYFLLDPEWAGTYSLTFNINCPGAAVTASDCNVAVNVCTNLSFAIDPNGYGSVYEIPSSGSAGNPYYDLGDGILSPWGTDHWGCLQSNETNSTWMVVNISGSGNLEFTFGGGGTQVGYYDWIMYPYNSTACTNIAAGTVSPVRCNWNDVDYGGTGLASTTPAGGSSYNFEPPLAVTAGQQYIICFSNWSSTTTTVPLQFGGTATVSCTPLPIELTSFSGAKKDNRVELKWTSASELNAKHYDITHSVDGTNFYSIGKVDAVGGVSNSDYIFDHLQPSLGANYYKLIAVDNDGSFDESSVVVVDFSRDGLTIGELQPNPVNELSYLEIISETETVVHLSLIDVSGRLIQKKEYAINKGLNKLKINYEPMPKGVYHVMVNTDNGLQFSKKMLVH